MSEIERAAGKFIRNAGRLQRLLALEKQRRGLSADSLAFIGIHNLAQHWWCTQQAVLKSRAEEATFFQSYIYDRIVHAHRLGLIDKLPRSERSILDIGGEITLGDVEKQLEKNHQVLSGIEVTVPYTDRLDNRGRRKRLINPGLPEAERQQYETEAEAEGIRVIGIEEESPLPRGDFLHMTRAEKYPHLRWNFGWGKYTVVGVADGLTTAFVYEYKTTQSRYLLNFVKPVALAQADLYGYFFRRPRKRVQIQIVEASMTETYDEPVDIARAEETLAAFARVDGGELPRLPKPWKCRVCDFKATCSVSQARG